MTAANSTCLNIAFPPGAAICGRSLRRPLPICAIFGQMLSDDNDRRMSSELTQRRIDHMFIAPEAAVVPGAGSRRRVMSDVASLVEHHYGRGNILARLAVALRDTGINPDKFDYADIWRFDQLHTRGIAATREHVERARLTAGMQVLDLGCGIGGSSRYLAGALGCRVTGVDLTPEYIDVARELTRRCGLDHLIDYRVADALALPFPAAGFDHVYSHNVTMNIGNKRGLAVEVARVLRPGAMFSCSELGRGDAGEVVYPVPWATDASTSFLARPAEMRQALEAGGLRVTAQIDLTEINRAAAREASERNKRGEPPLQQNNVVMGDDFPERAKNSTRGVLSGALVEFLFLAQKP